MRYLGLLLLLSGCAGRLVDWGKDRFDQGTKKQVSDVSYWVKNVHMYDSMHTSMLCTCVWISSHVRAAHDQLTGTHTVGEQYTFYLIADFPEGHKMTDTGSVWNCVLQVAGHQYTNPIVEEVELDASYQFLFKKWLNRFVSVYQITFACIDAGSAPVLQMHTYDRTIQVQWET